MNDSRRPLSEVQATLSASGWERRVANAQRDALAFDGVLERVRAGTRRGAALTEAFPERPQRTVSDQLARYAVAGWEALISRRSLPPPPVVVTPDVMQMVRGMLALDPELRSPALCAALAKVGIVVAESTLREHLHAAGLSHAAGRPGGSVAVAEPLPLAGAELWKAVEHELGAVRRLTQTAGAYLGALPAPEGEVLDDAAHRDAHGRFLPAYNQPPVRTEPELGGKFDTVARHRAEKDLREMRVANSGFLARYRKDLALTLLPVVVDTPRWTVLQHWQGDHLGGLVGVAYRPATLDKHAREMKLAGASEPCREAVASFWLEREGAARDEATGAVLVYCDASIKPIWTHHFTKCAKVSKTNRVMPGVCTVFLHSGAGTPLLYEEYSGHASVPQQVPGLLDRYEAVAGEGTVRRVVVLDRESHAVWLFKELEARGWTYIVPLRQSVVGPNARFEDIGDPTPYEEVGDTVRDGWLWLNDSRKGEQALRVRVVGRTRHRTDKTSWYATNGPKDEFQAADVLRLYFERWPLQEHVFRNGSGRVGLELHHGYGKLKVTDVAIVDQVEKLSGRLQAMQAERQKAQHLASDAQDRAGAQRTAIEKLEAEVATASVALAAKVAAGEANTPAFRKKYRFQGVLQDWFPKARRTLADHETVERKARERVNALQARIARAEQARTRLEARRRIFTVDTELDQILTAYKLTFMNVSQVLMREVLGDEMELETLIRGVLTLPGERSRTRSSETIRIYRQARDPRAMAAVERACDRLNAKGLVRDERQLRFELVASP